MDKLIVKVFISITVVFFLLIIYLGTSDFIINPSYLEHYNENKLIPFPIYGIFLHALFFKLFGIFSIITLEFILQFIFLIIFFKAINRIFDNLSHWDDWYVKKDNTVLKSMIDYK